MRRNRFNSVFALILVLCMMLSLLTSCGIFNNGKDDNPTCSHTNTSLQGVKAATCAAEGYTGDTVCNDCTTIVTAGTAIPKIAHTFDTGKITKQPTCIETGVTTFTCSGCGAIETQPIDTVAHNDAYHDAEDGTHLHTCANCPLNEKTGHNPTDAGTAFLATCTEPAYTELTCADCKGVYKVYDEVNGALGHDFGEWNLEKDSTCKSSGKKVQVCQRDGCGEKNTVTIPKSSTHNYSFSYYAQLPNCTTDGLAIYTCDDCGEDMYKELASNGVHAYVELESTGDGWVRKQCIHCYDIIASFDASQLKEAEVAVGNIDTESALEMNMQSAGIQFPQDVVGQIASGTNLSVSADVLDEATKEEAINSLPEEEKAILADAPIYDFTVKVDNTVFTDNFSTKVAITIDYEHTEADGEGIVIYYLANDGTIEEITDVSYDAEKKQVTFFVDHFSYYAVAYKETQAMRCKRGNHSYESTGVTVAPNCYTFGYTVYECVGCHKNTFDDIIERTEHNYGDLIDANPTCERGDYITRVCQNEGCGSVLNVKFVGATGHTMDKPATCTTSSTCTKCNKVLSRPLGHNWTEWETVVAPTGSENGLRRRYCLTCGDVDESVIAATGELDSITYDSYVELFEKIFGEVLGINSGVIEYTVKYDEDECNVTIELMKTERGYRAYLKYYYTYTGFDGDGQEYTSTHITECYYDNGVGVNLYKDEDNDPYKPSDYSYADFGDVDNLITVPLDIFKAVVEDIHAELDVYAVEYRDYLESAIDVLCAVAGDDIDDILAELGLPFSASQLEYVLDSVETVYAYLCAKLGFHTAIEKVDGVDLPTAEDWENTLSVFMGHSTDANGITTYTLDEAPIIDLAREIVSYVEKHYNDTAADFLYLVLKDDLLELDESIVSFDAFITYLKTNFPGNYTLSDVVDLILEAAESGDVTADELYDVANAIAEIYGYGDFDAESFVNENGSITLDELVREYYGNDELTVEDLYDAIAEQLNEIRVREIDLDGVLVEELCERLRLIEDNMNLSSGLTFSVDSEGLITSITVDHELLFPESGDPDAELVLINFMSINVERNSDVTVEIPEQLKPAMRDVTNYYDADGNLVITGLDPNAEFDFGVYGYAYESFSNILEKDATLSEEYGKNVYVNKPDYWTESTYIGDYVYVDGKYYDECHYYHYMEVLETQSIDIPDPANYLIVDEDNILGHLVGHDDVPLYPVRLETTNSYYGGYGIAYCIDGVWMFAKDYGFVNNIETEDGYYYYYVTSSMPLDTFFASIDLEAEFYTYDGYYAELDGKYYEIYTIRLIINGDTYSDGYAINLNGEYLRVNDYNGWDSLYSVDGCEPVELPAYDYASSYNTKYVTKDEDGNLTVKECKELSLYDYVPTYYARVTDDLYIELNSSYLFSTYDTRGLESTLLPDGNTLYVTGETMDTAYGYKYGYNVVYGYARTADGFYVQCSHILNGEETVKIMYRDAESVDRIYFNDMYDVNKYVTKRDNGDYVVSAELINKLKSHCIDPGEYFEFDIDADIEIDGYENAYYYYIVGAYMIEPEFTLDNSGSGDYIDDWSFWYNLFGNSGSSSSSSYTVVKNDDGSITIRFNNGYTVYNISYSSSVRVSVEDKLVKDNDMSSSTGLDIYKYETTYIGESNLGWYVYQDGKYYEYGTKDVYKLAYLTSTDFTENWYITDMTYRFDMIGAEGLPAQLHVYETSVGFKIKYEFLDGSLGTSDYYYINYLYTFYLDGVLQVALDAEVTGESLLTFESYMPLEDYIDSLEVEIVYEGTYNYSLRYLGNGEYVNLYYASAYVYETDENGNRKDDYSYYFGLYYVIDGDAKILVCDYYYSDEMVLEYEVDLSHIPADAIRYEYTDSYYNGTFTRVSFYEEKELTRTYYFVKLAGRFYRYNSSGSGYYEDYENCYQYQKIDEWSFNNQATDKAWVYRVNITDEYGNTTYEYYTEFIPSDVCFTPSGSIVDPSVIGDVYSTTLLGYTEEGYPLYEIAYWVEGDESPYTRETLSDGTVFLHKDGVGYLEVTELYSKYYVRARKVTMQDGSTEIYCFLNGAVLRPSYVNGGDELIKGYVGYDGSSVTISEEFLDIIYEKNYYYAIEIQVEIENGWYNSYQFNYYRLESFFMMAE